MTRAISQNNKLIHSIHGFMNPPCQQGDCRFQTGDMTCLGSEARERNKPDGLIPQEPCRCHMCPRARIIGGARSYSPAPKTCCLEGLYVMAGTAGIACFWSDSRPRLHSGPEPTARRQQGWLAEWTTLQVSCKFVCLPQVPMRPLQLQPSAQLLSPLCCPAVPSRPAPATPHNTSSMAD